MSGRNIKGLIYFTESVRAVSPLIKLLVFVSHSCDLLLISNTSVSSWRDATMVGPTMSYWMCCGVCVISENKLNTLSCERNF